MVTVLIYQRLKIIMYEAVYKTTLRFFIYCINNKIADKSNPLLVLDNKKQQAFIYFDKNQLVFSIEGLYHYLHFSELLTYNQYRRMLYQSELNKALSTHQRKIINYKTKRTDSLSSASLFCLVPML